MKRLITILVALVMTTNIFAAEYVVEETGLGSLFSGVGGVIDGTCRVVAFPFIWVGEGMKKIVPIRKKRVIVPDVVIIDREPTVVIDYPSPSLSNPVLTPETAPYYYQYLNYYNRQTPGYIPVPVPVYNRPYYYGRPGRYYGPPHRRYRHHHHHHGGRR